MIGMNEILGSKQEKNRSKAYQVSSMIGLTRLFYILLISQQNN